MDVQKEVVGILEEVLNLGGRVALVRNSPLLGAIPELDSMSIITVVTTIEERFGFQIADDELDASTFATAGALADFVQAKLAPCARTSDENLSR